MRGSPWRQLWLVVVAFAGMAWPVCRLTRLAPAPLAFADPSVNPKDGAIGKALPSVLAMTVEFVPNPMEFRVSYLSQTILQGKAQATATVSWGILLPSEGADLVLHAVWPKTAENEQSAAAAKVSIRWPDGREIEQSFWTKTGETLDTVITVPGGGPALQP